MTIPDDIKREAEEIVANWCVKDNGDMNVLWKRIYQAILSSRDQGYQEGVEDAQEAIEKKIKQLRKTFKGWPSDSIPGYRANGMREAYNEISSLKDKLKPKEKV